MNLSTTTRGLIIGVTASLSFGTSGGFIKPLLEVGWSPAAAVTVRAGIAGLALLPFALVALRGRWGSLWRARWRILGMGFIGVAGTQLAYFASIATIPVSTALLIEYLAPLVIVGLVWARTRRRPRLVVFIGSILAIGGLVLIIGPGALGTAAAPGATAGLILAVIAMLGVVVYYVIAARPRDGLPPVAYAASGLFLGAVVMGVVGVTGVIPFSANFGMVPLGEAQVPWWIPLGFVAVIGTGYAYAASIAASEALGSRLMSFVGLLEVVFASIFAWVLIGEALGALQLVGGVLILGGIALVRLERDANPAMEPGSVDEELATVPATPR